MSPDCISKLDDLICKDSKEVGNQALRGLYGQQSCCNDLQSLFKAVLIKGIQVKYNDPDASSPPIVLRAINKKQAECYCNWIDRQFPNDGTGGGGGGGTVIVEYDMEVPKTPITTPFVGTFTAIDGTINIILSVGSWSAGTSGTNEIIYMGTTARSLSVTINVAVSTVSVMQPIFYSYLKFENGVQVNGSSQGSALTPGNGSPHATVTFTVPWNPSIPGDSFYVTITQGQSPQQTLTLTTFDVVITEQ